MSSLEEKTAMWMLASRGKRKMRQKDGSWHTHRVKEYLRKVDKARGLLLFCMHFNGGQPARGPDILSLRYKDGLSQDRNIFVLDGLVMSVTCYHKTLSQWDVLKAVPRAARDGVLGLRAAAHGLYIPTFNRRCMETKEVGRKQVGCAMVRSPRP
jgi:hypothetical protein